MPLYLMAEIYNRFNFLGSGLLAREGRHGIKADIWEFYEGPLCPPGSGRLGGHPYLDLIL